MRLGPGPEMRGSGPACRSPGSGSISNQGRAPAADWAVAQAGMAGPAPVSTTWAGARGGRCRDERWPHVRAFRFRRPFGWPLEAGPDAPSGSRTCHPDASSLSPPSRDVLEAPDCPCSPMPPLPSTDSASAAATGCRRAPRPRPCRRSPGAPEAPSSTSPASS